MSAQPLATKVASDGSTGRLVDWIDHLRYADLDNNTRRSALRHTIDTIGVIVAGASSELTLQVRSLMNDAGPEAVKVPGLPGNYSLLDCVYLSGCAAHGLELDDGYRRGSVHPGVAVMPAALTLAQLRVVSGPSFLRAIVAGYETVTSVSRAAHPRLRQRGFHPTGVVGVFGSAVAASCLLGKSGTAVADALGLAASSAGGLFAFINGGAEVKRLHAGHASREGVWAAMLADNGIAGPPNVLEAKDGFMQAYPGTGEALLETPFSFDDFGINDCYIKPYPCCRHLQPALEALLSLMETHRLTIDDISAIDVETYSIAASHADTPWDSMASAQLSFVYILLLGLRFRLIELKHFDERYLRDPEFSRLAAKICIRRSDAMDALYPSQRPARVTLKTSKGEFEAFQEEALGSRERPLGDDGVSAKFIRLVAPICGEVTAYEVLAELWKLGSAVDVGAVLRRLVPSNG